MIEPVVLVHGGAGDVPKDLFEVKLAGVRKAAIAGYRTLIASGSGLNAIETAVKVMEDDPHFNAGRVIDYFPKLHSR
jgi:L-asparaginase / beta-aspartyl-peptidase